MALTQAEISKRYRESHPEKSRADARVQAAKYRAKYPEKVKAQNRRQYAKNLAGKDRAKKYRAENPEKVQETLATYRRNNPEKVKVALAAWHKANPHKMKEYNARRKARLRGAKLYPISAAALQQKWDYWGGRCWMCPDGATTWDHVKPLSKGGYHILANLRPACRPCNSRKKATWPLIQVRNPLKNPNDD